MHPALELFSVIKEQADIQIARLSNLPDGFYTTWGKVKADEIQKALDRLHRTILIKIDQENADHGRRTVSYDGETMGVYLKLFPGYRTSSWPSAGDIEASSIDHADISSIDSMLNIQLRYWQNAEPNERIGDQEFNGRDAGFVHHKSLKQALNIARNNFFSIREISYCGPLWGKTTALKEFETGVVASRRPGPR